MNKELNSQDLLILGLSYENGQNRPVDHQQAVSCYREATKYNNAEAEYRLGLSYLLGHGTNVDYEEAEYYLTTAAEQGHVLATYHLGLLFLNGLGVPKDAIKAFKYFNVAAEKDMEDAMYYVGYCVENKIGSTMPPNSCMKWYKKARTHTGAMVALAKIHIDGLFVPKSIEKAKEYINLAIKLGDKRGYDLLNSIEKSEIEEESEIKGNTEISVELLNNDVSGQGSNIDIIEETDDRDAFSKAIENLEQSNYKDAVQILKKLSVEGNAKAYLLVGLCYDKGLGVEVNSQTACMNIYEAAKLGSKQAIDWLLSASQSDMDYAKYYLAKCYENGIVVAKEEDIALSLYKYADSLDNGESLYKVGYSYEKGKNADIETAISYYIKSKEKGNSSAMYRLSYIYYKRKDPKFLNYLEQSVIGGNVNSLYVMAKICSDRLDGYNSGSEYNKKRAFKLAKQASDKGHVLSMILLSRFYDYGIGTEKSPALAEHWYNRAIKAGYTKKMKCEFED